MRVSDTSEAAAALNQRILVRVIVLPAVAALTNVNRVIALIHKIIDRLLVHEVISLRISNFLSGIDVRVFPNNALVQLKTVRLNL
jgi:hypothetical protein